LIKFLFFVAGHGDSIVNGEKTPVAAGSLVFVPAGKEHNFVNSGKEDLKLYTVYAPPQHKPGTVHCIKIDAQGEEPY